MTIIEQVWVALASAILVHWARDELWIVVGDWELVDEIIANERQGDPPFDHFVQRIRWRRRQGILGTLPRRGGA